MSDYTQGTFFTPKDSLAAGDANKTVRGTEIDTELGRIETAIATKYDVDDLASEAEAQAGVLNTVLMTPLRVADQLTADTMLVPSTRQIIAGSGLSGGGALTSDPTLTLDGADDRNVDHAAIAISAGDGLVGGGAINTSMTLSLGTGTYTTGVPVSGDWFLFYDVSAADHKKVDYDDLLPSPNVWDGVTAVASALDVADSTYDGLDAGQPTNADRFEIPVGTDTVALSAYIKVEGHATGVRKCGIHKNGTLVTTLPEFIVSADGTNDVYISVPRVILAGLVGGTDYIQFGVYQDSGGLLEFAHDDDSILTVEYLV